MDIASILGPNIEPRGFNSSNNPGNNGGGSGGSNSNENIDPTRKCQDCGITEDKKSFIHSKLAEVRYTEPNPHTDRTIIRCGFDKADIDSLKRHVVHQIPSDSTESYLNRLRLGCQTGNVSTINTTAVSRVIGYFG